MQTEGLVGWREEREAQFSGLGLPRKPRGPGSTGQEPSRPRPDPKVARAWSLELQIPTFPSPTSCPTNMPQLAPASGEGSWVNSC